MIQPPARGDASAGVWRAMGNPSHIAGRPLVTTTDLLRFDKEIPAVTVGSQHADVKSENFQPPCQKRSCVLGDVAMECASVGP